MEGVVERNLREKVWKLAEKEVTYKQLKIERFAGQHVHVHGEGPFIFTLLHQVVK